MVITFCGIIIKNMHRPLYREILAESWRITRQAPWLWLFASLALFLGNWSAIEVFLRAVWSGGAPTWPTLAEKWQMIAEYLSLADAQIAIWSFVVLALFFIFAILAIFIVVTANGALVLGIAQYRKSGKVNVTGVWQSAAKKFLPLFSVAALFQILILAVSRLVNIPLDLIAQGQASQNLVALFPLFFIVAAIISLVLSFLATYSFAYILLKKKNFLEAVAASWRLFQSHWLVSLELSLIIFGLTFLLGAIGLAGTVAIFAPVLFISLFSQAVELVALGWFAAVVGMLLFALLMLLLVTLFFTFQTACFTLLFLRLEKEGAVSKAARIFNRLLSALSFRG